MKNEVVADFPSERLCVFYKSFSCQNQASQPLPWVGLFGVKKSKFEHSWCWVSPIIIKSVLSSLIRKTGTIVLIKCEVPGLGYIVTKEGPYKPHTPLCSLEFSPLALLLDAYWIPLIWVVLPLRAHIQSRHCFPSPVKWLASSASPRAPSWGDEQSWWVRGQRTRECCPSGLCL